MSAPVSPHQERPGAGKSQALTVLPLIRFGRSNRRHQGIIWPEPCSFGRVVDCPQLVTSLGYTQRLFWFIDFDHFSKVVSINGLSMFFSHNRHSLASGGRRGGGSSGMKMRAEASGNWVLIGSCMSLVYKVSVAHCLGKLFVGCKQKTSLTLIMEIK